MNFPFQSDTTTLWSCINKYYTWGKGGELYVSESWILFELGVYVRGRVAPVQLFYFLAHVLPKDDWKVRKVFLSIIRGQFEKCSCPSTSSKQIFDEYNPRLIIVGWHIWRGDTPALVHHPNLDIFCNIIESTPIGKLRLGDR